MRHMGDITKISGYTAQAVNVMNGDFEQYAKSNAIYYAWYVWVKGYTGDTVIKWIN